MNTQNINGSKEKVVLVTGGAGYIGSHVCKTLAQNGFLPIVYDNLSSGNAQAVKWGPLEIGDIRDRERLAQVMKQYKPASIIHLAALIQVGESVSDPMKYYNNNVYGSMCLLEEACAHNIKSLVFSSTAAVYGLPDASPITEDMPLQPINPYGQTKLAMENMIRDFSKAYDLNFAILRYFNAAGADPEADTGTAYKVDTHLIPLLMKVANDSMPSIKIFGTDYQTEDGTAMRDYVHVSDLAEAHMLSLRHLLDKKGSLTLNLGTNSGYSVQNVVDVARRATGRNIPAESHERRTGDPAILVADASKAREILGWSPRYSDLQTIISTAWQWKQKQSSALVNVREKDFAKVA